VIHSLARTHTDTHTRARAATLHKSQTAAADLSNISTNYTVYSYSHWIYNDGGRELNIYFFK